MCFIERIIDGIRNDLDNNRCNKTVTELYNTEARNLRLVVSWAVYAKY